MLTRGRARAVREEPQVARALGRERAQPVQQPPQPPQSQPAQPTQPTQPPHPPQKPQKQRDVTCELREYIEEVITLTAIDDVVVANFASGTACPIFFMDVARMDTCAGEHESERVMSVSYSSVSEHEEVFMKNLVDDTRAPGSAMFRPKMTLDYWTVANGAMLVVHKLVTIPTGSFAYDYRSDPKCLIVATRYRTRDDLLKWATRALEFVMCTVQTSDMFVYSVHEECSLNLPYLRRPIPTSSLVFGMPPSFMYDVTGGCTDGFDTTLFDEPGDGNDWCVSEDPKLMTGDPNAESEASRASSPPRPPPYAFDECYYKCLPSFRDVTHRIVSDDAVWCETLVSC